MFLPNPISIIRIVEYSTISVLEYFGDTLANVGLPEAWLECDSNFVTRIKNKYIGREYNQIEKKIESNQIKTTIKSNQIGGNDPNTVGNGCHNGTAGANDGPSAGYLMWRW